MTFAVIMTSLFILAYVNAVLESIRADRHQQKMNRNKKETL